MRLIADSADVVALQEVPLWGISRLAQWAGMRAFAAPTKRALLGRLARTAQRLDPKRVRSPLTGQASAILIGPRLDVIEARETPITPPGWPDELRFCQHVRVEAHGRALAVANLHATTRNAAAARAELERVAALVEGEQSCVVLGDFNLPGAGLPSFSTPLPGIDQVLVRGLELVEGPAPWPEDRRAHAGRLLSDHAPVEAVIEWS